jgi:hypothetical protein
MYTSPNKYPIKTYFKFLFYSNLDLSSLVNIFFAWAGAASILIPAAAIEELSNTCRISRVNANLNILKMKIWTISLS